MMGLDPGLLVAIGCAEDYLKLAKNCVRADDCFFDYLKKAIKILEEQRGIK